MDHSVLTFSERYRRMFSYLWATPCLHASGGARRLEYISPPPPEALSIEHPAGSTLARQEIRELRRENKMNVRRETSLLSGRMSSLGST